MVIKEQIWIKYDIERTCNLWPELNEDEIMDAIVDHLNKDSQPTFVFDRMLLMGPVSKSCRKDKVGSYDKGFSAQVDFMTRCDLKKFELHAVVVDFDEKDGKKTIYINSVAVYGMK